MHTFRYLMPLDTMERISRQKLCEDFDNVLERVDKEDIGFVIVDDEGKEGHVLCPARWMEYCFDDDFGCIINSALRYVVGGTKELCLNITYNYACVFRRPEVLGEGGIRSIYGKTGAESIPVLQKAIEALSDEVDPDYWKPAEGNVKKSLYQLLSMARMRPDGVWDGD